MNKNGDHAKAGGPITAYRQWRRRTAAFFLMLVLFCDPAVVKAAGTSGDDGNERKETVDSSWEERNG